MPRTPVCFTCNNKFIIEEDETSNNNNNTTTSHARLLTNQIDISEVDQYSSSLLWGGYKWDWDRNTNNPLTYYFGTELEIEDCPPPLTNLVGEQIKTEDWTVDEKESMRNALLAWTNLIGMAIEEVTNVEDANLRFYITDQTSLGLYGAQFGPFASEANQGTGIYVRFPDIRWSNSLNPGGNGFTTMLHEIGHGLGLSHPHDAGGGSTQFPGVSSSSDTGHHELNQNIYSVMTYNDYGSTDLYPQYISNYGTSKGPMAFDIKAIEYLYGLSDEYKSEDNVYTITDNTNTDSTGYNCIVDNNGNDLIVYNGNQKVTIDLRPASITKIDKSGGYISKVDDVNVKSGFTIYNNTIIEQASGGLSLIHI